MDEERLAKGAELFRRGAYFEAHEVWEDAWRPLPPGPDKEALKGLIQAAVALHHRDRGNLRGARTVGARALRRLRAAPPSWQGLAREVSDTLQERCQTPSLFTFKEVFNLQDDLEKSEK